ncbi:uncharacterized protein [Watersipora subatra]|uniref:uncharacterized protein n=1 Tax=Watersipora subatra TaxID=2589382 RepID=UPI00355BF971
MGEPRLHLPDIRSTSNLSGVRYEAETSPVLRRIPTRIRAPPLVVGRLSSAQKLRREKTFASASTAISKALDDLYHKHIHVDDAIIEDIIERTNSFLYTITHRINKNRHNLKFGELFMSGPAVTGLCNKHNYHHITIYFPLKFKDYKLRKAYEGYTSIHTSRNASFDRFQSIRSDAHKNLLSPLKISKAIHELMTHICQSIGRGVVQPFYTVDAEGREKQSIVILLDDVVQLTVVPALQQRCLKKDEDGTLFVTKPYSFDKDPNSDTLWRYDNPSRATRLIEIMNRADRRIRSKALRLIHIILDLDSTLQLCSQEFLTMILYDMFDEDVDRLPSWQMVDLERCFTNILSRWHQHMITGVLHHPFAAGVNVLATISEKDRLVVRNRLARLLSNRRELVRLLKKGQDHVFTADALGDIHS